jgi:hypothetical protein
VTLEAIPNGAEDLGGGALVKYRGVCRLQLFVLRRGVGVLRSIRGGRGLLLGGERENAGKQNEGNESKSASGHVEDLPEYLPKQRG